ncbi:Cytochrome c [Anatilimnocola aggregata]|uniref:Cytochrome c n=1 Tax=Anatilimnocola aggregata TaxID=2528021 RepID=A0A517YB30_9BACT|nr:PVC-type heme-binding CxxCH protein [Anatilimnocola aggregata]QDU27448.1 Cytochrome c [Anatilimnocola aggregata]
MQRITFVLLLIALSLTQSLAEDTSAPVPTKVAASRMKVPEGFHVSLFAGEPDIVQPIAFTFDDRGRLWVVECLSYPQWSKTGEGRDRVTILEDRDGDGTFDEKTIFYDKGVNLSGIEWGYGGVWLTAVPNLIFIPDRNGDDKPDGEPVVVLNGFDLAAKHNVVNGLAWGPDGYLYGLNGILSNSRVGRPGQPDAERKPINCGVWRVDPKTHEFEPFAYGTTNPWGLDWNEHGQLFITNCVIKHLFHVVQGGHYERMFGQDLSPRSYGLIQSCADHLHWGGGHWTSSRGGQGIHNDAGGGHAHSGCLIYQGDAWPEAYRNRVYACNIHGARVNQDRLEPHGSGYVAKHEPDFLHAGDPWFRGLAVKQGPDGSVYMTDWCDTGECHDYIECDHSNGRIYKITHGTAKAKSPALQTNQLELAKQALSKNEWLARHARRRLQEMAATDELDKVVVREALITELVTGENEHGKLRALWALQATRQIIDADLRGAMRDENAYVRTWAVTLAVDSPKAKNPHLDMLLRLAAEDRAPQVRLALASALQRLTAKERLPLATRLVAHEEDAGDHHIPLMLWYGIEPIAGEMPAEMYKLLAECRIPLVRQHLVRRLLEEDPGDQRLATLIETLGNVRDAQVQLDLQRGILLALEGRRSVPMPMTWPAVFETLSDSRTVDVQDHAVALAVKFDDAAVIAKLKKQLVDMGQDLGTRQQALALILTKLPVELPVTLHGLLREPAIRAQAIKALAAYNHPGTPAELVNLYGSLTEAERADVVQTLASRPAYAVALLSAVQEKKLPRTDITAGVLRQLQALNHKDVAAKLEAIWGTIRPAAEDKKELAAKYKSLLTTETLATANASHGRAIFAKNCASCHKLFDEGGKMGPDLTGSQRTNLDYVLENALDPSAVVPRDYQVTTFLLDNGRVVQGIVLRETAVAVTAQTPNEVLTIPVSTIEERKLSKLSMMPEGIFQRLSDNDVRDLVAYLASSRQVPLPMQ